MPNSIFPRFSPQNTLAMQPDFPRALPSLSDRWTPPLDEPLLRVGRGDLSIPAARLLSRHTHTAQRLLQGMGFLPFLHYKRLANSRFDARYASTVLLSEKHVPVLCNQRPSRIALSKDPVLWNTLPRGVGFRGGQRGTAQTVSLRFVAATLLHYCAYSI